MRVLFENRRDAGRQLAQRLSAYSGRRDVVVLALPRGGVPVGFEVAAALGVPLDAFLVRKLGVPGYEELAMGAIAAGGVRVVNEAVVEALGLPAGLIDRVAAQEEQEILRRNLLYRGGRPPPEIAGKTIVLVDDGLATGASMRAAVSGVLAHEPAAVVVAAPVGSPEGCASFEGVVDEVVCVATPRPFFGVGAWYRDFSQTSDETVRALLDAGQDMQAGLSEADRGAATSGA